MMHAARKLPMLSAMMKKRNVRNALKEMMVATLLHSVPPLVASHTPSATQVPENAHHVTQKQTRTAPKLRMPVTKNVLSNLSQHVALTENAQSAQKDQAPRDVSQLLLVNNHANHTHHHTHQPTDAHGTQPPHNVLLTKLDPKPRPSANNNAKSQVSLNATSRTTLVKSVNTVKTQNASRPLLSARLSNNKEDARLKN